jgi:hypothetical protein
LERRPSATSTAIGNASVIETTLSSRVSGNPPQRSVGTGASPHTPPPIRTKNPPRPAIHNSTSHGRHIRGLQLASTGASLGLGYWRTQRKIVLPQALSAVVPGIMNNFISLFKDTSLVTIVSLYELTGALQLAVGSDPNWRPFKIEAYVFIAAIYFACCFSMSRYSLRIEKRLARSQAR